MYDIEKLYYEYSKDIYSYLLYLTNDESLSQDILQETFLQAIRGIKSFRGDSNVKTWLFSIARNIWISQLRKKKLIISDEDISNVIVSRSFEEDVNNKVLLKRIYEIIDSKNEKTKEIAHMRLDGYSFYDISQKLGISESSARVIDFRCKKEIREILVKEGYCEN